VVEGKGMEAEVGNGAEAKAKDDAEAPFASLRAALGKQRSRRGAEERLKPVRKAEGRGGEEAGAMEAGPRSGENIVQNHSNKNIA